MRKYLLLISLSIVSAVAVAQERNLIKILNSKTLEIVKENGETRIHIKNPVFGHENAVMTCDSAVLYQEKNYFEAFRNVHINQADTVNIYAQRLTYDGNTKIAHLSEKVSMLHKDAVLTTNLLDYFMAAKIGQYYNGGKIVNKDINITSRNGYYFANSRDAYFRYKVVAVTEQSTITSDTLRYNTLSNLAYFYGPTNIKGKDDNMYTENGLYNTKTEDAWFGKKNLYTNGSRSLKGDSLFYNGKKGYGRAVRNIVFIDTNDKTVLHGHLGEYFKPDQRAVVTQNAYFGMRSDDSVTVKDVKRPDSLFIGADTLETQMVLQSGLKLVKPPTDIGLLSKPRQAKPANPILPPAKEVTAKGKQPAGKAAKVVNIVKPGDTLQSQGRILHL